MRHLLLLAVVAAAPLAAAEQRTAASIIESPLTDVNLKKQHIAPLLPGWHGGRLAHRRPPR